MQTKTVPDTGWTPRRIARRWGKSATHVYSLIRAGQLRALVMGAAPKGPGRYVVRVR